VDTRDLAPGFFQRTGIPESPYRVSTSRGDHYYYDGRGLALDDFPVHGGVSCGDIISAGGEIICFSDRVTVDGIAACSH